MKKRFSVLVFKLLFINAVLCQPLIGQNDVIIPLRVGNYWEFSDSTFSADSLLGVDTSRVEITGKTIIEYQSNSYEVFFWNWFDMLANPPQPLSRKWLIRNEPDGLWEYGMLSDTDTVLLQNRHLKFPANIGESWQVFVYQTTDTSIQIGDTLVMECVAIDQEFNTPIGTFQCYVYRFIWIIMNETLGSFVYPFKLIEPDYSDQYTQTDTLEFLLFYAPNVGLIGQEMMRGTLKRKSVLYTYNLITDIHINENNLNGFELFQNYPNPFNPVTLIRYNLPERSEVKLLIYDVLGNVVANLVDEEQIKGNYEIKFDGDELSSGVYFYQMRTDDFVQTNKMILLR